jgi:hypothetical protein
VLALQDRQVKTGVQHVDFDAFKNTVEELKESLDAFRDRGPAQAFKNPESEGVCKSPGIENRDFPFCGVSSSL